MRKLTAVTAAMTILLGACTHTPATTPDTAVPSIAPTESPGSPVMTITLEPGAVHQTITGFGASGCWWAKDVGGWQQEKVDRIIELLFSSQSGIGLTIYRHEVGGGGVNNAPDPWRRAETFETAPGQYDWSLDANAVSVLRKAVAAGADNVMFFANTPPGRMTVSGKTTGEENGGPNLMVGMEDEFARYLVDIALHFKAEGIPVKYISPVNEPQWNWKESNGQEGCHYLPGQIVTLAQALVKELDSRGEGIKPSLVDSGKWLDPKYTVDLLGMLANDPAVGPAMDHWAAHSYWSEARDKQITAKLIKDAGNKLPLWQTEWCQMKAGRDLGMDAALVLAQAVHEDMTILGCEAWISWIAVSCYDYKDGLVYVDLDDRDVFDSKRLWALGNYSRFIKPGYRRVEVAGAPEGLLASAYLSPDGSQAVIVAINPGDEDVNAMLSAGGYDSFKTYVTSDGQSLELAAEGKPDAFTFAGRSVTTVVLER